MRRCDTVSVRVSAILDERRRVKNLTIRALAARADLARHATGYALDGRTMRTSTLAKLADALDCELVVTLRPRQTTATVVSAYASQ